MNNKTLLSFFAIISLLLVISCGKREVKQSYFETSTLCIDPTEESEKLMPNDYTITKVMPLENVPNTNLLECDKIEIANGRIYILDRQVNQGVVVYDTLGHFLYTLGSIGHSASELLHAPTDFAVNARTGSVYLFDNESNKILVYDNKGSFTRNVRPGDWPYAFAVTENDKFLFAFRMRQNKFGENSQLGLYGPEGKQESIFRSLAADELFSSSDIAFTHSATETFYIPNLCDTVFAFRGDTIHRAIHLDFDGKFLTPEQQAFVKEGELEKGYKGTFVRGVYRYLETDTWIGVVYNADGMETTFLQNRKSDKTYNSKSFFSGLFPNGYFALEGENLVFPITENYVLRCKGIMEDLTAEEREEALSHVSTEIRDFISGNRKYPALIFVRIND